MISENEPDAQFLMILHFPCFEWMMGAAFCGIKGSGSRLEHILMLLRCPEFNHEHMRLPKAHDVKIDDVDLIEPFTQISLFLGTSLLNGDVFMQVLSFKQISVNVCLLSHFHFSIDRYFVNRLQLKICVFVKSFNSSTSVNRHFWILCFWKMAKKNRKTYHNCVRFLFRRESCYWIHGCEVSSV